MLRVCRQVHFSWVLCSCMQTFSWDLQTLFLEVVLSMFVFDLLCESCKPNSKNLLDPFNFFKVKYTNSKIQCTFELCHPVYIWPNC